MIPGPRSSARPGQRRATAPGSPAKPIRPTGRETVGGEDAPVRSVARAIDILFTLERGRQTAGDVARATGLSKVTARRLLATLVACDLVIHDAGTSTYLLGPGCYGIFDAVVRGAGGLDVLAGSVLRRLAERTRETVAVYVRAGPKWLCVAQVPSGQAIRYTAHMGIDHPMESGAMDKVLLAFGEPAEREELLERVRLVAPADPGTVDRDAIEQELRRVKRLGYAVSHGERTPGVTAIAAPIFSGDGRLLAALSVVGPDDRLPNRTLAEIRPELAAAASEVSDLVARQGNHPG